MATIIREEQIGDCRKRSDKSTAIYALCEIDGTPRYVGKTDYYLHVRHKAHISEALKNARLPVHRWLKKRAAENQRLVIKLLEYVPFGRDWAKAERRWIANYREVGFPMLNLTDGGEGLSGHVVPQSVRDKISASNKTGATFNCEACGSEFYRKQKDISAGNCRFCSRGCYQASLRGVSKPMPERCKSAGIAAAAAARRARTICKRGHQLSGQNLFITSAGARGCKECRHIHKAAYVERKNG